ncbi:hypothetical protein ACU4GA_12620 [Methylobacterium oryzae CBMB20]
MREFRERQEPIKVSFRQLVPWVKIGERATHYLHPYPAKLLPQIAHFFLAASAISQSGSRVLDPFAGTGTVALETILSGRVAIYAEVNPLARLIVETKTRLISPESLARCYAELRLRSVEDSNIRSPDVINKDLWYEPTAFKILSQIKNAIEQEPDANVRSVLEVAFSVVARKSSRADPRFSVPVRRESSLTAVHLAIGGRILPRVYGSYSTRRSRQASGGINITPCFPTAQHAFRTARVTTRVP